MIDLLKKTIYAGIGMGAMTKEKVMESLEELVQRGRLSREEAEAMSNKILEEGEAETEKARAEATKLFNEMLQRANVVTREQYDELAARVTELEGRLHREFPNNE